MVLSPPRARIGLLGGLALGAFLLSMIGLLPARVALGWLGLNGGSAAGTVWHGTLQSLTLNALTLGPIRWQVQPLRLFKGQLGAAVQATLPGGFVTTDLGLTLGGGMTFEALDAAAPLGWLVPAAAGANSQLTARFEKLTLKDGRVTTAKGKLRIAGVVLPLPSAGTALAPGNYDLRFDAEDLALDAPLSGALTDGGGALEIAGTLQITPPSNYTLMGTAKPRSNTPPELRNALRLLGPATPDGGYSLSLSGSL